MAGNQEFIDALKEADKIAFIKTLITPLLATLGATKVDKVSGKGLSKENFTTVLKNKLVGLEGSHFKGTHADEAALIAAHPTAEAGSYAYVLVHTKEHNFIWGGTAWVDTGSVGTAHLTDSQIKTQYENNPDTNAFDDAAVAALAAVIEDAKELDWVAADPANADDNKKTDHTDVGAPLVLTYNQVMPSDQAKSLASKELLSIGNLFKVLMPLKELSMMDKGVITDIGDITETGIYAGDNVLNSPTQGGIMVMANKDGQGNFGYFLMGADRGFHTGGRASGTNSIDWTTVEHKAVSEGSIDVDTTYSGGYPMAMIDSSFTGITDLFDGNEHKVTLKLKAGTTWADASASDDAWYLKQSTGEMGHFVGDGDKRISKHIMQLWVDSQSIITIKYTGSTKKTMVVSKVEAGKKVRHVLDISSDGSVQMEVGYVPTDLNDVTTKGYVDSLSVIGHGQAAPIDADGQNGDIYYQYAVADQTITPSDLDVSAKGVIKFYIGDKTKGHFFTVFRYNKTINLGSTGLSGIYGLKGNSTLKLNTGTEVLTATKVAGKPSYTFSDTDFPKVLALSSGANTAVKITLDIPSGKYEEFHKVNGKWVEKTTLPKAPTADGEYKLKVLAGVMTWVAI